MNNEELKRTILIFINEYHNSLFNIPLNEKQLDEIFNTISEKLKKDITKKKDILVVRPPEKFQFDNEVQTSIRKSFWNYFELQFFTVVLFEENDTDKTQFEIIKC